MALLLISRLQLCAVEFKEVSSYMLVLVNIESEIWVFISACGHGNEYVGRLI